MGNLRLGQSGPFFPARSTGGQSDCPGCAFLPTPCIPSDSGNNHELPRNYGIKLGTKIRLAQSRSYYQCAHYFQIAQPDPVRGQLLNHWPLSGTNLRTFPLMQYRLCVGGGPSSNTCPRGIPE